ncbi:2-oxoisovalerate dehydrogenase E1 subunit beta [Limnospira fusiformis]
MNEIIFWVECDAEEGYVAQALGESIITQADNLDRLKLEVRDAVRCHFPDEELHPRMIRLVTEDGMTRVKGLRDYFRERIINQAIPL